MDSLGIDSNLLWIGLYVVCMMAGLTIMAIAIINVNRPDWYFRKMIITLLSGALLVTIGIYIY